MRSRNANKSGRNPRGLRNVLITRFSAIGDVAMAVPVIYNACMTYPDVHFVLVTRPSMTSIFLNAPENLTVVGADLKVAYNGLSGVRRLFRELRKRYDIDGIVDLHDVLRTKYMRLLGRVHCMAVTRIHKGRESKRALTRQTNKVMLPLESSRSRYRGAFSRIGLPVESHFDGLWGKEKAPAQAYAPITTARPEGEHWVGIAPFAKHDGKIYPPEYMEEVVKELSEYGDIRIFLFGGGDREREILSSWASKYKNVRSLAGERHGFGVELALMSNFDCMVSMDSANMHLASLVSIPVVSVWGATHPYCGFKGWRQSDDNIIQLPLTCRPCSVFGDKPCYRGDNFCLRGIKPRIITDKVIGLLGKTRNLRQ